MYSEEYEDLLYRKLSKILELTSLIFGHYKNTGQKERAHSLIVWVVSALQAQWRIQDFPGGGANSQNGIIFSTFC